MPKPRKPKGQFNFEQPNQPFGSQLEPFAKLWAFRILIPLQGLSEAMGHQYGFSDASVPAALGLQGVIDEEFFSEDTTESSSLRKRKIFALLTKMYWELEGQSATVEVSELLTSNVKKLAELIGLAPVEQAVLQFFIYLDSEPLLQSISETLGELTRKQTLKALATILNLPYGDVQASLRQDGLLARSGLLTFQKHRSQLNLQHRMELLSDNFSDRLLNHEINPVDILRSSVISSSPAELALSDFSHIEKELQLLLFYMQHVLRSKRKGVNIFVYGPPGTGKSQLVKVVGKHFDCELMEVSNQDEDGDTISGFQRFRSYRAAQCIFANQRTMLLFDEVEDVLEFDDAHPFFGFLRSRETKGGKSWINRTLEDNAVPTFWLSNSSQMDEAYLRRFDMVIKMPMPTEKHRKKILNDACQTMLSENTLERLSKVKDLSPAIIHRAASVVSCIQDQLNTGAENPASEKAFELLINNTLVAQQHPGIPKPSAAALPDFYDPAYVNATANGVKLELSEIADGLKEGKSARICFYGGPGTGKTAYGRWLADELEMPLMVKRASDMFDMYVGNTEKRIAEAFAEAERENALLLIDEVDSFLQDRRGARQSWEVSFVNEMLTQMENFNGLFIASTNLMEGLDQAALRRFDMKIHFDFLLVDQAWKLMQRVAVELGLGSMPESMLHQLAQLRNVTPGDFAAIRRQHRFKPLKNHQELFAALVNECSLKEDQRRTIGFN